MGQPLRTKKGKFTSVKSFFKKVWYYTKVGAVVSAIYAISVTIGVVHFSTSTVEASVNTVEVKTEAPVLQRIYKCESGNHQFAPSGQVLMKPNTNGTVDVGIAQINTVWFAQASKLGFDLTTEKGNKAMAEWLYANKGTSVWYSSSACWNK